MHAAAASFSRPSLSTLHASRALVDTLQQIALRSPQDVAALHVWAEMILTRLLAEEQQRIRDAAKG